MCQESVDARTEESFMIGLTKAYLIKNKDLLISYAINEILTSNKKYRFSLKEEKENFYNSVDNDFNLIITYCDELDDDIYENRIILNSIDYRIYRDFYNILSHYIESIKQEFEDEWMSENLIEAFSYLEEQHSKD